MSALWFTTNTEPVRTYDIRVASERKGPEAITFSCVAQPERLQALEELLAPYGIKDLVRTGRIALDRDGELGTRKRMRVVA